MAAAASYIPYFEKFPETYKRVVIELFDKIAEPNTSILKKLKLFDKFSEKFTTIPEIWNYRLQIAADDVRNQNHYQSVAHTVYYRILKNVFQHLYHENLAQIFIEKNILSFDFAPKLKKVIYWPFYDEVYWRSIYHENSRISIPKTYLTWPHWKLRDMYRLYNEFSLSPLSKIEMEKYKKAVNLFDRLVKFENDDEKWLHCLLEIKDDNDFIIQNLACRIGKFPWNQNLWKINIIIIKEKNPEEALEVYRKYCRLFIEDFQARQEYQNLIIEKGNKGISVQDSWADLIQIYSDFGSTEQAYNLFDAVIAKALQRPLLKVTFRTKTELSRNLKIFKESLKKYQDGIIGLASLTAPVVVESSEGEIVKTRKRKHPTTSKLKPITFKNNNNSCFFPQRFSLPSTIIHYIIKFARHPSKTKLLFSSKYFYSKQPYIPCHRMESTNSKTKFIEHSIQLNKNDINNLNLLKNLYITNGLYFTSSYLGMGKSFKNEIPFDRNYLQNLLSNIYKFDGAFIKIIDQNITWKDYCFLTNSNRVESLHLCNTSIISDNEKMIPIPIEEIISKIPNAFCIYISKHVPLTFQTASILANLKRKCQFTRFSLTDIDNTLEVGDFCKFLDKNIEPRCHLTICFKNTMPMEEKEIFNYSVKKLFTKFSKNKCPIYKNYH